MKQLSAKDAKIFYAREGWRNLSPFDLASFQLFQDRVCVPFGEFHKCLEEVLGRPVLSHEFANSKKLGDEYVKKFSKYEPPMQVFF